MKPGPQVIDNHRAGPSGVIAAPFGGLAAAVHLGLKAVALRLVPPALLRGLPMKFGFVDEYRRV